jgi:hypothetical protein
MLIPIEQESSFLCPEGYHRATFLHGRFVNDDTQIRLTFGVHPDGKGGYKYLVAKNYDKSLKRGSQFRNMLKSWRGHDLTQQEVETGFINLDSLKGKEVDIEVRHIHTERYDKPFVNLHAVFPPGTHIQEKPCPKNPIKQSRPPYPQAGEDI